MREALRLEQGQVLVLAPGLDRLDELAQVEHRRVRAAEEGDEVARRIELPACIETHGFVPCRKRGHDATPTTPQSLQDCQTFNKILL